jgi:hypothetical protein
MARRSIDPRRKTGKYSQFRVNGLVSEVFEGPASVFCRGDSIFPGQEEVVETDQHNQQNQSAANRFDH